MPRSRVFSKRRAASANKRLLTKVQRLADKGHKRGSLTIFPEPHFSNRASVAIVLRLRPTVNAAPHANATTHTQLFQSLHKDTDCQLEVLYMKRAINKHDRWSGHVSFPGGRKNTGEDDLRTCIRETHEELGLDLASADFTLLSRLDDTRVKGSPGVSPLVVSSFVFLQLCPHTPEMHLSPSEVSDVMWVPLHWFVGNTPSVNPKAWLGNSLSLMQKRPANSNAQSWTEWMFAVVTDNIGWPGVYLLDAEGDGRCADTDFLLWGLTMRMTCRFLLALGERDLTECTNQWKHKLVYYMWGLYLTQLAKQKKPGLFQPMDKEGKLRSQM